MPWGNGGAKAPLKISKKGKIKKYGVFSCTKWRKYVLWKGFYHDFSQAHSQDRFGEVQDPQKWTFWTQKVDFFEPHPPYPPTKTPFLAHFVAKSGPFGRFGGCIAPPGYGPDFSTKKASASGGPLTPTKSGVGAQSTFEILAEDS